MLSIIPDLRYMVKKSSMEHMIFVFHEDDIKKYSAYHHHTNLYRPNSWSLPDYDIPVFPSGEPPTEPDYTGPIELFILSNLYSKIQRHNGLSIEEIMTEIELQYITTHSAIGKRLVKSIKMSKERLLVLARGIWRHSKLL